MSVYAFRNAIRCCQLSTYYFCNMKKWLLLLFLIVNSALKGQDREIYYDHEWKVCSPSEAQYISIIKETDSGWLRKDYFVSTKALQMSGLYMDEATEIKNGRFYYFYANGVLKATGKMINNKKEGTWLSYHTNGMLNDSNFYSFGEPIGISLEWHSNGYIADSIMYDGDTDTEVSWYDNGAPSSAGRFIEGKQTGVWQYFHKNGTLAAKEKYNAGKLLMRQYYDTSGIEEADTTSKDRDADFKGGEKGWSKFVYKQIYFPRGYRFSQGDKVTVLVTALIDEEGNVTEPFVELPVHPDFDKIAISIFKRSPKWIPAIRHNRTVKQYIRQGVTFEQN